MENKKKEKENPSSDNKINQAEEGLDLVCTRWK